MTKVNNPKTKEKDTIVCLPSSVLINLFWGESSSPFYYDQISYLHKVISIGLHELALNSTKLFTQSGLNWVTRIIT
jgi:hypothetical protein